MNYLACILFGSCVFSHQEIRGATVALPHRRRLGLWPACPALLYLAHSCIPVVPREHESKRPAKHLYSNSQRCLERVVNASCCRSIYRACRHVLVIALSHIMLRRHGSLAWRCGGEHAVRDTLSTRVQATLHSSRGHAQCLLFRGF